MPIPAEAWVMVVGFVVLLVVVLTTFARPNR